MIERINKLIAHLKETREILSQAEFAEKIDIKASQISEMLNGKRTVSERTVRKIVQSFPCINGEWLITGEGEMLLENREETNNTYESSTDLRKIIALLEEKADRIERENISLRNEIESLKKELSAAAVARTANAG